MKALSWVQSYITALGIFCRSNMLCALSLHYTPNSCGMRSGVLVKQMQLLIQKIECRTQILMTSR